MSPASSLQAPSAAANAATAAASPGVGTTQRSRPARNTDRHAFSAPDVLMRGRPVASAIAATDAERPMSNRAPFAAAAAVSAAAEPSRQPHTAGLLSERVESVRVDVCLRSEEPQPSARL